MLIFKASQTCRAMLSPFLDLTGDWGWADRKVLVLFLLDYSTSSLKVVDIRGRVQKSLWLEF